MANTVKVRFLEDRTVQDTDCTTFKRGQTYSLSPRSADRWVRRGAAEIVTPAKAKAEADAKAKAKAEDG